MPIHHPAEQRLQHPIHHRIGLLARGCSTGGITRAAGHMSGVMAEQWIACTESVWRQAPKLVVFNDWERMESYESVARKKLTDWVIAHRTQMEGAWFLTGSRIVAMGVAAAGAASALVGVSMHASLDRVTWERALRDRLQRP